MARSAALACAAACAVVPLLAACGGSSQPAPAGSSQPIVFGDVGPFTGPDADFGTELTSGCAPAALLINRAGGVVGHQVHCLTVDTRGDPADAVPAVSQMLATTTNLVGVIGPTSDEASATVPLIDQAHVPTFGNTGEAAFDHSGYAYFYRLIPADDLAGYAMAVWAHKQGYTRGAAVFGNDTSAQGTVPTLLRAYSKLGGTVTINEALTPDQTSYRSEIERMLASHPQVIFTETDPQTAATYFSELRQLGHQIPVIGADPTVTPEWFKAVAPAMGMANLLQLVTAESPTADTSGPAWAIFKNALFEVRPQVSDAQRWSTDPYSEHNYDAANIMALAMVAAGSTKPSVYARYIARVTAPVAGAVKVDSFAAGKRALGQGKRIQYVGPGGPVQFDPWRNAPPSFEIDRWDSQGNTVKITDLPASDIAPLLGA